MLPHVLSQRIQRFARVSCQNVHAFLYVLIFLRQMTNGFRALLFALSDLVLFHFLPSYRLGASLAS